MKLVIISTLQGASWGGSEELWSSVARHARSRLHEVKASVQGWSTHPSQWTELRLRGVEILTREQDKLSQHLEQLLTPKPDLVLVSLGDNGASAVPYTDILSRLAIPTCIVCHNAADWWWWPDTLADQVRDCFTYARAVYFVSKHNLTHTEFAVGEKIANATIVKNPLTVAAGAMASWPKSTIARFACVGRLQPAYKGQDILLAVFSSKEWRLRNFELSFYGSGDSEQTLRKLTRMLNLHSVHFRGFVSPESIWAREQILILPSRAEGTPLVLQDAMYLGRPAIVTDVGGNADLIRDSENGFVADAPTVKHVKEALERAWQLRDRWPELGRTAASDIRRTMTVDPSSELLHSLESLLL